MIVMYVCKSCGTISTYGVYVPYRVPAVSVSVCEFCSKPNTK